MSSTKISTCHCQGVGFEVVTPRLMRFEKTTHCLAIHTTIGPEGAALGKRQYPGWGAALSYKRHSGLPLPGGRARGADDSATVGDKTTLRFATSTNIGLGLRGWKGLWSGGAGLGVTGPHEGAAPDSGRTTRGPTRRCAVQPDTEKMIAFGDLMCGPPSPRLFLPLTWPENAMRIRSSIHRAHHTLQEQCVDFAATDHAPDGRTEIDSRFLLTRSRDRAESCKHLAPRDADGWA